MKTYLLLIFLLSFSNIVQENSLLPKVQPCERTPINHTFHEALTIGLDHVYNHRYSKALVLFDSLQQVFTNHPAPNFYIAAAYQNWMLSFRFNKFQKDLYENV